MLGGKGMGNRRAKGFCVEISVIESVAVPGLEIVTVTGELRLFRAVGAKLIGLGDFRPSFGRFNVIKFEMLED